VTHINSARPGLDATPLVYLGYLAFQVATDPAVQGAWREAAGDCSGAISSVAMVVNAVTRAVDSVARAGSETAASWRRHGATAAQSSSAT
jgi:hypothetical protein